MDPHNEKRIREVIADAVRKARALNRKRCPAERDEWMGVARRLSVVLYSVRNGTY